MKVASLQIILFLMLPAYSIVLIDTILRLMYISIVLFRSSTMETAIDSDVKKLDKILFLIAVRNEEQVIGSTVSRLKQTPNKLKFEEVIVIADHCSDRTAEVASKAGAEVLCRFKGQPGKGPALAWFAQNNADRVNKADIIVVLDADTQIDVDFGMRILEAFTLGVDAVQAFILPLNSGKSILSTLSSYSELLSQNVDDRARTKLFWPIPLRGAGMAFRHSIFCKACSDLTTQVDDIELTIRLAGMGIPVHFASEAIVYDPKSSYILGLARQRGRWLKGQRQIFSMMRNDLMKIFLSGISGWSLIQALLFKPKTLLLVIKIVLIIILCFILSSPLREFLEIFLVASIWIDLAYYCLGLRYVSDRRIYMSALLKAPFYLILWLVGWVFSFVPGQHWLRARD